MGPPHGTGTKTLSGAKLNSYEILLFFLVTSRIEVGPLKMKTHNIFPNLSLCKHVHHFLVHQGQVTPKRKVNIVLYRASKIVTGSNKH